MSPDLDVYRARRAAYLARAGDGPTLLVTRPTARRNGDVDYDYRPDSDFYFLTGFPEPDAAMLLIPGDTGAFILFVQPREPERETWDGPRIGLDRARTEFGADASHSIDDLFVLAPSLLQSAERIYTTLGNDPAFDRRVIGWMSPQSEERRKHRLRLSSLADAATILGEQRLRKDVAALALMRTAASITVDAHQNAMRAMLPGLHEYEVAATLEYHFGRRGARPGYPTIVGSGPNATTLHHIENRRRIEDGDLVLVDAGAEWDCFTADVTRTFPANGSFSAPQREIYELVLAAHSAAIEAVVPGAPFDVPDDAARDILVAGMIRLGLLSGEPEEALATRSYRRYFMHKTSHWLGMDVHDAGAYRIDGLWRRLEPGMVLTIEPGLYVRADDESAPERYRGIGVRIEDDICVTPDGSENLTRELPTSSSEIERLMRSQGGSRKGH